MTEEEQVATVLAQRREATASRGNRLGFHDSIHADLPESMDPEGVYRLVRNADHPGPNIDWDHEVLSGTLCGLYRDYIYPVRGGEPSATVMVHLAGGMVWSIYTCNLKPYAPFVPSPDLLRVRRRILL